MMRNKDSQGYPYCPYCDSTDYDVLNHDTDDDGSYKKETYDCVCLKCGREYTNVEYWSMNDNETLGDGEEIEEYCNEDEEESDEE